jgi:hypothetical protein
MADWKKVDDSHHLSFVIHQHQSKSETINYLFRVAAGLVPATVVLETGHKGPGYRMVGCS